jgi:hypothetical protein
MTKTNEIPPPPIGMNNFNIGINKPDKREVIIFLSDPDFSFSFNQTN